MLRTVIHEFYLSNQDNAFQLVSLYEFSRATSSHLKLKLMLQEFRICMVGDIFIFYANPVQKELTF